MLVEKHSDDGLDFGLVSIHFVSEHVLKFTYCLSITCTVFLEMLLPIVFILCSTFYLLTARILIFDTEFGPTMTLYCLSYEISTSSCGINQAKLRCDFVNLNLPSS